MTPPDPTYRVLVYELADDGQQTTIMDTTAAGFIAATGTITDSNIEGELGDGGPRHLLHHIATLIARQKYPA